MLHSKLNGFILKECILMFLKLDFTAIAFVCNHLRSGELCMSKQIFLLKIIFFVLLNLSSDLIYRWSLLFTTIKSIVDSWIISKLVVVSQLIGEHRSIGSFPAIDLRENNSAGLITSIRVYKHVRFSNVKAPFPLADFN